MVRTPRPVLGFKLLQIYGFSQAVLVLLQKYGLQSAATDLWYGLHAAVLLQKYGDQSPVPLQLHQLLDEAV